VLVSACWGVARRLLAMRRSWVRFPQAAPAFVQVRATFRVLRTDPSPPAWDGDRPRARARARQRRTPRFAYFIGVSPRLVFTTLTCGPVPEPDDLTRTPGSVRFPVCLDLIAKARIRRFYAPWRRPGASYPLSPRFWVHSAPSAEYLRLFVPRWSAACRHRTACSALLVDRNASWASAVTFGCSDMPVVDNRQIIPRVRQATRGKHL
jgi:hypothetical protein